jgi:hypothetical protein
MGKYTLPHPALYEGMVAVALDPSGTRFWVVTQGGDTGVAVYLFDVSTGIVIAGPYPGFNVIQSLAVAGEPRAALRYPRSRPSRCCPSR